MAKVYLLRRGYGEDRVASSRDVDLSSIEQFLITGRVKFSPTLPIIQDKSNQPANWAFDPEIVVIELSKTESSSINYDRPGFYLLENISVRQLLDKLPKGV